MKRVFRVFVFSLSLLLVIGLCGCHGLFQTVRNVDTEKAKPMDAKYDYSDLHQLTDEVSDKILVQSFLKQVDEAPIVVILGIENRTREHLDTKALTDTLRGKLINSRKMRFVNAARRDDLLREQKYQQGQCTPETQAKLRSQLGAKYMLTGSIVEMGKESGREVRISKKEEIFYQLTVEITDLETGLIVAAPQAERARLESRPIIGW
jgi:uncharacterized protein (TIGR02722 family)